MTQYPDITRNGPQNAGGTSARGFGHACTRRAAGDITVMARTPMPRGFMPLIAGALKLRRGHLPTSDYGWSDATTTREHVN